MGFLACRKKRRCKMSNVKAALFLDLIYFLSKFLNCQGQVCSNQKFLIFKILVLNIFQVQINLYKYECPKDNETEYLENIICKFHKNSKGTTLMSTIADLLIPVRYIDIQINVTYQNDKEVINNRFEYCSTYNNLPIFVSILFGTLKQFSNDLIHPCPYKPKKQLGVENFPIDTMSIMFSTFNPVLGNYKISIHIYDKKGKLIFFMIVHSSLSRKRPQKGVKSG